MKILYKLFKTKGKGSFFTHLRKEQQHWTFRQWLRWWKADFLINWKIKKSKPKITFKSNSKDITWEVLFN